MFKFAVIGALLLALTWQSTMAVPMDNPEEVDGPPEDYEVEVPTEISIETDATPTDDSTDSCKGVTCEGEKGDKGPQGPPGEKGEKGEQGFCDASSCPPGPKPPPGEKGMKGEKGDPGVPGATGVPGKPGVDGVDGADGEDGMKGVPGMPGMPGPEGPQGPPGEPGSKGMPGMPGPQGPEGPQGNPGRKGMPGMKGEKGEKGSSIEIITRINSGPCTMELQGVIRFDPDTGHLFYCNGTEWLCIQTKDCPEEAPTCPSPFGEQQIRDKWYQVFVENVTRETQDAADIVLIVDDSGSMITEQRWLLTMVPALETTLIRNGVGDGDVKNRYCLVGYGGFFGREPGHFRLANGQVCFTAAEFPEAQRQLELSGISEDGYQAMQFALENVPFRDSPFIAKNFILVTDEERDIIPLGEDITRESIQRELVENDIILNAVVFADYKVFENPEDAVIGVDARGVALVLAPNGTFSEVNGNVTVTGAEGTTTDDYVNLAVSVGGASWALRILREASNAGQQDLVTSFTAALTQIKLREIRASIESCRKCMCVSREGPEGELIAEVECSIAQDAEFCRCVVGNGGSGRDISGCVPSLPGEGGGDEVSGGLVRRGNSIAMVPKHPHFVLFDSETMGP